MRVLHVISSMDFRSGGPATALTGLATAQARVGMDVTILHSHGSEQAPALSQSLLDAGVEAIAVGPTRPPLASHPELRPQLAKAVRRADVVHLHGLWEQVQYEAARQARAAKIPYIIRSCGMLDPWSLAQSRWRKRVYMIWRLRAMLDGAAAMHFTTDIERDLTQPLRIKARGIVEPNGIDPAEFATLPALGSFRRRVPALAEHRFALFVSRIHPKKGCDFLLKAFAGAGTTPLRLVIAGPGEPTYISELQALAGRLGVADRVVFQGMLSPAERTAAMVDSAFLVLPSSQENFGNVVIESFACGRPVMISDQVNLMRAVESAKVGAVLPLEQSQWSTALQQWGNESDTNEALEARCRQTALDLFAWPAIAQRWKSHYAAITGARQGTQ